MYELPQQLLSNLTIAAARDIRTKFQDKALGYEENWQKCLKTEQNQL